MNVYNENFAVVYFARCARSALQRTYARECVRFLRRIHKRAILGDRALARASYARLWGEILLSKLQAFI